MTIPIEIKDGKGSGRKVKVSPGGRILSLDAGIPEFGATQLVIPFRQFLTDDGTSSGSNDMQVNGSSTPVEFWIPADTVNDRYITNVSFVLADAGAQLNNFGNIADLTNGCDFEYEMLDRTITIADGLATSFDFVRLSLGQPSFGNGSSAFRATNVAGNSEGYIPFVNFQMLVPPYGLLLKAGTSERLILRVNDNTTGVDAFNAIAYGFERLPDVD